jgi:hypothetical protein
VIGVRPGHEAFFSLSGTFAMWTWRAPTVSMPRDQLISERPRVTSAYILGRGVPAKEMGAGIAASPHCAERRICRCS